MSHRRGEEVVVVDILCEILAAPRPAGALVHKCFSHNWDATLWPGMRMALGKERQVTEVRAERRGRDKTGRPDFCHFFNIQCNLFKTK